jgi:hypothetical protein
MIPALVLAAEAVAGAEVGSLAVPALGTLLGFLFGAGAINIYENNKDEIKELFTVNDNVVDVKINDTKSTKEIEPIFSYDDYNTKKQEVQDVDYNDYTANYVKFKMIDDYLSSLDNATDVPVENNQIDLTNAIQTVSLPDSGETTNLIDVMKSNTKTLSTVLTALNNTVANGVVANSAVLGVIAKGLNGLVNEIKNLNKILVLNGINNSNIANAVSNLKLEAGSINIDNSKINEFIDFLKLNGFQIKNSAIENSLNVVAQAKVLEKENFEYMKTPQTYTLSDEALPELAPRDVIALSEAVKAHLNSQEASITGDEISEFENDFDLGDVLTKLFNFKGITGDINEINEKLKENEGVENGS